MILPAVPAAGGGRDEARDLLDLLGGQLVLERRHAVAAVRDLPVDGLLVRPQLVEVRARPVPFASAARHRVAVAAAGVGEDLRARASRRRVVVAFRVAAAAAAAAPGGEEKERDEGDRERGDSAHPETLKRKGPPRVKRLPTGAELRPEARAS